MNELPEGEGISKRTYKKHKKLTSEEKWRIYDETNAKGAPVGEILRRNGMYASELTKIRQQIEEAALKELRRNKYKKKPETVDREEYEKLAAELRAKEKALAQMGEEYLILKKKTS